MRNVLTFGLLSLILLTTIACEKEEEEAFTPAQLIEGKWTITSQEILTTIVPGDGSYLQFNACSSACYGEDYRAIDTASGSFTYVLNDAGTIVTIDDQSSDGGSWNATWDILELTETKFRITATTILGNLKVEMSK